jgi:hypothetical protein
MSDQMQTDRILRRLERIDVHMERRDPLLDLIATIGRVGAPLAIGLVIDGTQMTGTLHAADSLAEFLDTELSRAMIAFYGEGNEAVSFTAGAFAGTIEQEREKTSEARGVLAELWPDGQSEFPTIDSIPLDDIRQFCLALEPISRAVLTQARILTAGEWIDVEHVSIDLQRVSAWWPLSAQAGTTVSYSPMQPMTND